ncbi:TldD/PmbA family protein [Nanoarchaeota archaeon]
MMSLNKILSIKHILKKAVNILEETAPYADAAYIYRKSTDISKDNTNIETVKEADRGIKLRVFDGEKFIEEGFSDISEGNIIKKANFLRWKIKKKRKTSKTSIDEKIFFPQKEKITKHFSNKPDINPDKISIKQKIEFVKKLQKKVSKPKYIINARIRYDENYETKIFVNRNKSLSQNISGCHLAILPFIQSEIGDMRYHYSSFFKPGYEVTKLNQKDIKEAINTAKKMIKAKKIKPGKYTCILSPHVSGILAHESFGHGMEADTIMKDRAKAKEYIGKRIAKTSVSIVDDPSFPDRHGSFFFDDEGIITKPTYLIKKGIVGNPISDLYSTRQLAKNLKIQRSGNARAESYDHKVYSRMSNTYFLEGKHKLKSMQKKVKDGMFLHNSGGGMEDPKGWGVQIQGVTAERIKNGRLTGEFFYEIGITGYLPNILGNIAAVSDKLEVPGTGHCGKGHKEWVKVSEGGPHLLIKNLNLS